MKTENNLAAQAGDEPMRKEFEEWMAEKWFRDFRRNANGDYIDERVMWAWEGFSVSPRATADVERYQFLRDPSNTSSASLVCIYSRDALDAAIDAAIATTKPGA